MQNIKRKELFIQTERWRKRSGELKNFPSSISMGIKSLFLNQCSSKQWRAEFFKSSWMASCPERTSISTWLVGAFPHLNHTTFGGEPYNRLLSAKSASWVTIQKWFNLAKSQISVSVFSASSWNCTWLALGKISAKRVTIFRLRFWSNSSFKQHLPKQLNDDRDQPQTLDRL